MHVLRKLVVAAVMRRAPPAIAQAASAFELTGAMGCGTRDQCSKVFSRKGRANQVSFTIFPASTAWLHRRSQSRERKVRGLPDQVEEGRAIKPSTSLSLALGHHAFKRPVLPEW